MSAEPDFGLSRIGQIAVPVHDLERAIGFYRDKLGIAFLFQAPGMGFFQCGGITLMLGVPEKPEFDHPASIIYYSVDHIEDAHRILESRGVRFIDAPHVVHRTPSFELWMSFFHDSEENVLALMEQKAG